MLRKKVLVGGSNLALGVAFLSRMSGANGAPAAGLGAATNTQLRRERITEKSRSLDAVYQSLELKRPTFNGKVHLVTECDVLWTGFSGASLSTRCATCSRWKRRWWL